MARSLIAYFDSVYTANKAVQDLARNDFAQDMISLMISVEAGLHPPIRTAGLEQPLQPEIILEGPGAGLRAGAVVGSALALAGSLLLGSGILAVPTPAVPALSGPLESVLAAAAAAVAAGAAAGGLAGAGVGAVLRLGIPEAEIRQYAKTVRQGKVKVALLANRDEVDEAIEILNRHRPLEVREERISHTLVNQSGQRPPRLKFIPRPRDRHDPR